MSKKIMMFAGVILLMLLIPYVALIGAKKPENLNSGNMNDKGKYLVLSAKTGEILKLSPSEYIKGVVAAEMPASYSEEALKAQAVASHTYMIRQIGLEQKNKTADLKGAYISTDPAKYQAYLSPDELKELWGSNYDIYWKKISKAVDEVISYIITYENKPIAAAFHAISNGETIPSQSVWGRELPYLKAVACESDELSPDFEKTVEIPVEEFKLKIVAAHPECTFTDDAAVLINVLTANEHGYVEKAQVGSMELSGTQIRSALSLKSASFTAVQTDGIIKIATKGYGHGVGMSQYGADFMARQGKKYNEILSHFFPETSLTEISK